MPPEAKFISPEKKTSIQFILGTSADRTQRIRFKQGPEFTLLSLDIAFDNLNSPVIIPALTVSHHKGVFSVSLVQVDCQSPVSHSISYSGERGTSEVNDFNWGYNLDQAQLLIARGAFSTRARKSPPDAINVAATYQIILKELIGLAEARKGFRSVTVSELVRRLFR